MQPAQRSSRRMTASKAVGNADQLVGDGLARTPIVALIFAS